jgi:hypothetical protein
MEYLFIALSSGVPFGCWFFSFGLLMAFTQFDRGLFEQTGGITRLKFGGNSLWTLSPRGGILTVQGGLAALLIDPLSLLPPFCGAWGAFAGHWAWLWISVAATFAWRLFLQLRGPFPKARPFAQGCFEGAHCAAAGIYWASVTALGISFGIVLVAAFAALANAERRSSRRS